MAKQEWYTWTVEFKVHRTWVEDGFDLTDERAHDMLNYDLQFADGAEIQAKVLSAPDADAIAREQGYADAADRARKEAGDWTVK